MELKFPKVELHSHLEGTIAAETLIEMAADGRENMLPSLDANELKKVICGPGMQKFNSYMDITRSFRYRPDDVRTITKKELDHAVECGVVYAEYRFNFDGPMQKGSDPGLLLDVIREEMEEARREKGLLTDLIFGIKRCGDIAMVSKMVGIACEAFKKGMIAAIDMNGDELSYPIKNFRDCLIPAIKAECPLTLHAGEWDGAASVRDAIACGAKRIGHGVRAIEDAEVVRELIDKKICLEICPTSNVFTEVYKTACEHPVRKLFDSGVLISINSDDHGVFGSDIAGEYALLETEYKFSREELAKVNENALNSAFISNEEKKRVFEIIRNKLNENILIN